MSGPHGPGSSSRNCAGSEGRENAPMEKGAMRCLLLLHDWIQLAIQRDLACSEPLLDGEYENNGCSYEL